MARLGLRKTAQDRGTSAEELWAEEIQAEVEARRRICGMMNRFSKPPIWRQTGPKEVEEG